MGETGEETLGLRIRRLRKERKMTQETLSRKANMSYVALVKVEQGKVKNPSFQVIYRLAKVLEIDLNSFSEGLFDDEIIFKP